MDEHNLDRHLKAYCDMHEEYQNLYATWSLNRKSCSEILKNVLLRYPHYSLHMQAMLRQFCLRLKCFWVTVSNSCLQQILG